MKYKSIKNKWQNLNELHEYTLIFINWGANHRSVVLLYDDVVELVETKALVAFGVVNDVGIMHHFSKLVIIQGFAQFLRNSLETVEIYNSITFIIPKLEHLG